MRRAATAACPLLGVLVVAVAGLALLFASSQAHADDYSPSSYGARLLALINGVREQHGLAPVVVAEGTTTVATDWTQHLVTAQELSHNPDLAHQLETHGSSNWQAYGENVAKGWPNNPDGMFNAYMNSPEHRDNILTSAFRYAGIDVIFSGSRAWNTIDFVDVYSGTTTAQTTPVHAQPAIKPARPVAAAPPFARAVPTAAAAVSTPAPRISHARPAHARAGHRVHVEGLLGLSPPPADLAATAPNAASAPTAIGLGAVARPGSREFPIAVAFAVLAFVAASRRWVLEVSRPLV